MRLRRIAATMRTALAFVAAPGIAAARIKQSFLYVLSQALFRWSD
jgi:hypothetical protein